jgi:hypothetical protein
MTACIIEWSVCSLHVATNLPVTVLSSVNIFSTEVENLHVSVCHEQDNGGLYFISYLPVF